MTGGSKLRQFVRRAGVDTPGRRARPTRADDGFLTLAEIYELNLRGTS